jgi:hypothetical protein
MVVDTVTVVEAAFVDEEECSILVDLIHSDDATMDLFLAVTIIILLL